MRKLLSIALLAIAITSAACAQRLPANLEPRVKEVAERALVAVNAAEAIAEELEEYGYISEEQFADVKRVAEEAKRYIRAADQFPAAAKLFEDLRSRVSSADLRAYLELVLSILRQGGGQ